MKTGCKFTHGGKDYTHDIKGGMQAMMREAVYKQLNEKLGTLMKDIDAEGGNIIFDGDTGKISFENLSQDLITKIEEALK